MKKARSLLVLLVLLAGCTAVPPRTPTATETSVPPTATETITPTVTATVTPESTATPVVFEPIELGSPRHPAQCTLGDYRGRVQTQERKDIKPFPEGTPIGSWSKIQSVDNYTAFYYGPIEIASFCRLTGDFFGVLADDLVVIGYHIPDKTDPQGRFLHGVVEARYIKYFVSGNSMTKSRIGISNPSMRSAIPVFRKNGTLWAINLFEQNLMEGLQDQISLLLSNRGHFPAQLETELFRLARH